MGPNDLSRELVEASDALYGHHEGKRAVHTKGVCCTGTWKPTAQAAEVAAAPHFASPTDVTVRFSNAAGRPDAADFAHDGRGMATKFHLEDGTTDIVALSLPVFFAKTPEDFLEFMRATVEPEKLGPYLAAHPEAAKAIELALGRPAPESYVTLTYNSIHAFRFHTPGGEVRFGRYRWEPSAGESTLSDRDAEARGPDYLREELAARLEKEPAVFTLRVQFASEGDDPNDPTKAWPLTGKSVVLGHLTLTAMSEECEKLVFDPCNLTDGITPSDDPILLARPGAYSVSIARRMG